MNNVLVVYQCSEFGDIAQTVSKSKLSALIGYEQKVEQKVGQNAVRLIPIYSVHKIVSAKARL